MSGGYLRVPKVKMMLLSPPNYFGNQVTSHKSPSSSASPNGKDSVVAGLSLLI